jgi:hypothetical protein
MKVLFLHGWKSTPGGLKPTFLKDHGHEVLNPALPDDDFEKRGGRIFHRTSRGKAVALVAGNNERSETMASEGNRGLQLLSQVALSGSALTKEQLGLLTPQQLLSYYSMLGCELPEEQIARMSGHQLLSYVSMSGCDLSVPQLDRLTCQQLLSYVSMTGRTLPDGIVAKFGPLEHQSYVMMVGPR